MGEQWAGIVVYGIAVISERRHSPFAMNSVEDPASLGACLSFGQTPPIPRRQPRRFTAAVHDARRQPAARTCVGFARRNTAGPLPLLRLAHTLIAAAMRRVGAVHGLGLGGAGERWTMAIEVAMRVSASTIMSTGIRICSRIGRPLSHALLFGAKQLLEMRGCDFGTDRAGIGGFLLRGR